jgi:superfamily I DNA and/or RNA helicase
VIVSLVRSNKRGNLGFIEDKNRINVALPRAKIGLYVLGNFEMIKKNVKEGHLWQRIIGLAEEKGYLFGVVGTKLPRNIKMIIR